MYHSPRKCCLTCPVTPWSGQATTKGSHALHHCAEKASNARVAGKAPNLNLLPSWPSSTCRARGIWTGCAANLSSGLRHDAGAPPGPIPTLAIPARPQAMPAMSARLAWRWVQSGKAVLIDMRTDAERSGSVLCPAPVAGLEAVGQAWPQPDFDAGLRARCARWLQSRAAVCRSGVRSPCRSAPRYQAGAGGLQHCGALLRATRLTRQRGHKGGFAWALAAGLNITRGNSAYGY